MGVVWIEIRISIVIRISIIDLNFMFLRSFYKYTDNIEAI